MISDELRLHQLELAPKDDLSGYAGPWVALRYGRVVAEAADPDSLRKLVSTQDAGAIINVASTASGLVV